MQLYAALFLLALGVCCAVVLFVHRSEPDELELTDDGADPAVEAWHAAALDAHWAPASIRVTY